MPQGRWLKILKKKIHIEKIKNLSFQYIEYSKSLKIFFFFFLISKPVSKILIFYVKNLSKKQKKQLLCQKN